MSKQNKTPGLPDLGRCPNCKGVIFYVESPEGRMDFFVYGCDGRTFSTAEPHDEVSGLDLSDIQCVGCSWHGTTDELAGCDPDGILGAD